jgi:hypothetical protein
MSGTAGTIELWRQDDHGHRFLVGRYLTRVDAERRRAQLTRCQHKQTYWIVAPDDAPMKTEPT